ncbi:3-oxo-tetronate kinase [Vannielia litorea]|uniref:3-oxo-tetronate kinase n=1 Tax=Vannielia litorea TaxID=1217970 RepID=UPI001BCEBE51|nr:3-oxo-tetronate kinase [Vannielia litorea]MBS8227330.1 four-carbon acid sugar kinase family protein [Vannielia litorea]
MAIFGAIADDFTGATDLAGLLARSGAKVSLRIGVPEGGASDAPFEVVALKIRTAPVAEAVTEALAALDWLKGTGAERFFWKYCSTFDSTADGNIGPVAEALMAALGARQTVYCPAFPENGRSVFMGNLFVGQQPLAESPMKDHPLTPMADSNLMRLLRPQVTQEVGLVDRLTVARGAEALKDALGRAAPHVVVDAVADTDLEVIARAGRDMALMTGGSALAMPLPALYREAGLLDDGRSAAQVPQVGPGAVVLSGSCSAMTRAQVAAYGGPSFRFDPLMLARDGYGEALDWLSGQDMEKAPMIYATAEPEQVRAAQAELGVDHAGAVVEEALAALAIAAREMGARRFVVAGGETSGAVTKALGVSRLDVGREIAPGVPWCGCVSGGQEIALALKSGNFGAESFFADALGMLG